MPKSLSSKYFVSRENVAKELVENMDLEMFDAKNTITIGISEGGVYFAHHLAQGIECDMDILLTEPIKAPNNEEATIAMISETQEVVMNKALIDSFDISEDFVYTTAQDRYDNEVVSYVYKYRKGEPLVSLQDKDVILVDECVESGLTMMASIKSVIERGAKNVYIATPILDKSVYDNLQSVCDGVFCPYKIEHYISIEYYFEHFNQITFKEIEDMMKVYANNRYNETMK